MFERKKSIVKKRSLGIHSYGGFAKVYDVFMDDIPYDEWAEYIVSRLNSFGLPGKSSDRRLLELGCGTGNMSRRLVMAGFDVTGIDISDEMVKIAMKKGIPDFAACVWDMRVPFKEKGYDLVVSFCDSMNYLAGRGDLELTFRAAYDELKDEGIFMFDMKTASFYKMILGDNVFADNRGDISYIWENYYNTENKTNTYDITFYQKVAPGLFRSFKEHHVQRAYSLEFVQRIAAKSGFEALEAVRRDERIYYIFRKTGKEER